MFKRILMIGGIFLVGITAYSLINNLIEADTDKKMKESIITKEAQNVAKLKEKLHESYVGIDVKTTSKKELIIQVVADQDGFNIVQKDIASITKRVIETSPLKDYTIVLERWELTSINDKVFPLLIETLTKGLKEYEVFENIVIEGQPFIMVHTSIKGSGKDARKLVMAIKEKVNEILDSKEMASIPNIDLFEIVILNASGKVIN